MEYTIEKINKMIKKIDRLNERCGSMEANIRKEVDRIIESIEKLDKGPKKEYLGVMARNLKKIVSNDDMVKIMGTRFIISEIQHLKDVLK